MIFEHTNYRSFLNDVLVQKKAKNPAYSMSALAKQFGISQPALSQVLTNKKGISLNSALRIAGVLKLKQDEADYFCLLVQVESTKDPGLREVLLRKLQGLNPRRQITDLSAEAFRLISDPYHYTILLLTEVDGFEFTPENITRHIGVNKFEVIAAIERLEKLELLEKVPGRVGQYRRVKGDIQFASDVPNQALQSYHEQVLNRAIRSLKTQTPKEKIMSSEQVALSEEDIEAVRKMAKEFYSKVIQLSKKSKKKSAVYNVGVQVFKLSHERKLK